MSSLFNYETYELNKVYVREHFSLLLETDTIVVSQLTSSGSIRSEEEVFAVAVQYAELVLWVRQEIYNTNVYHASPGDPINNRILYRGDICPHIHSEAYDIVNDSLLRVFNPLSNTPEYINVGEEIATGHAEICSERILNGRIRDDTPLGVAQTGLDLIKTPIYAAVDTNYHFQFKICHRRRGANSRFTLRELVNPSVCYRQGTIRRYTRSTGRDIRDITNRRRFNC